MTIQNKITTRTEARKELRLITNSRAIHLEKAAAQNPSNKFIADLWKFNAELNQALIEYDESTAC